MSERRPKSYQRFFAELKRRQVFRVMAVYGIVGFVILQVADLAIPALLLPDWTYRFVALILLLGFPIALIITWAFEVTPEGIRKTEAADPAQIEAIVAQPASRRWTAGLLALLGAMLLLAGGWWAGRQTAPDAADEAEAGSEASAMRLAMADAEDDDRPSIAVLPFADMSPQGDQEYFSDGITEELLNTLAKIRDLKVMARTSAFAFKGERLDIRVVGDSLGAQYVIEGSVRKEDDQLRITAQLIDAEDGSHLWSDSYDRKLENVFEIQTEIATAIAENLRVPLGLDEGQQLASPTEDLDAYELYLAGRARMRERGEGVREAVALFEGAIARDSSWAPAWAGLAESLALVPFYPMAWTDSTLWKRSLAGAEEAAERALELDPDNASALIALGNVHRDRWDWDEAESAYHRALTIDPENVEGLQQYSEFLMYVGRLAEAYRVAKRALELDPSPIRMNALGLIASLAGRPEEAIDILETALVREADPLMRQKLTHNLMAVHMGNGNWQEVRRLLVERVERNDPALAERVRLEWSRGMAPPPTLFELPDLQSTGLAFGLRTVVSPPDRALALLEERYGGRDGDRVPYGPSVGLWSARWDRLRNEPRFRAILADRGLEGRRPQRLEPGEAP